MHLLDAATGKLRGTASGKGAYQSVAFSPDGTLLATAFGTSMYAGDSHSRVQLWRLPGAAK